MKKHGRLLISILLLFLLIILPQDGHITAATIHEVSGSSTIIDSYYSFAPKFTPGVSWAEFYGCRSYDDSALFRNEGAASGRLPTNSHLALLSSNALVRSGTIGVRYNNIGHYNGSAVDLKIMLVDGEIRTATTTTHPDINMPSVAFMDNSIDIYQQSYQSRNFVWQFTFYRRGTNTPISVPFHANFKDIDNTEILGHGYSGIDGVYVMSRGSGGNLSYNSSQVYAPSELSGDDDRQNWATLIGVASSFRLGYTRRLDIDVETWDKGSDYRTFYHWKWSNDSLVKFDTPVPTKRINGSTSASIYNDTAFNYTVDFAVPPENATTYYTSFKLNDTLASCLQLANGTSSITIRDSAGNDVTSKFDRTISAQSIQLSLRNVGDASFYGKSYTVTLKCKKRSGHDLSAWFSTSGSGSVRNTASITTDRGTKTSNAVTVGFYFKITTSVTNGTITPKVTGIDKKEDRTITYTADKGYYLRRLRVDGKEVDVKRYPTSYTFHDISSDHVIKAEFLPIPELRITKRIYGEEMYPASGDPTFLFHIEGTDFTGERQEYTEVIRFTASDKKASGGIEKTIVRKDIPAGEYEISEIPVSRYRLDSITDVISGKVSGSKVTLDTDGQDAKATFVNRRKSYQDYSDNDLVVNTFHR